MAKVTVKAHMRNGKMVATHTRLLEKAHTELKFHNQMKPRFYGQEMNEWEKRKKNIHSRIAKYSRAVGKPVKRKTAFEKFEAGEVQHVKGYYE